MEFLVMLFIVQKTSCDVLLLLELLLPVMASRARLQCCGWVMMGGCCWREKKWRKGAGWDGDEDESYLARVLACSRMEVLAKTVFRAYNYPSISPVDGNSATINLSASQVW